MLGNTCLRRGKGWIRTTINDRNVEVATPQHWAPVRRYFAIKLPSRDPEYAIRENIARATRRDWRFCIFRVGYLSRCTVKGCHPSLKAQVETNLQCARTESNRHPPD
jgi:hypothetical protein